MWPSETRVGDAGGAALARYVCEMTESFSVRRYRLRAGIAPAFATFLAPGQSYVGHVLQSSPRRDPPLVRLFHPADPTVWEDVPFLALDEVAAEPGAEGK